MPAIFPPGSFDWGTRPLLGKDDRMRASLRKVGCDRLSASGRVLPVALLVLLATTAGCSGDRGKPVTTGDTTGAATRAAATDTANKTATARDTLRTAPAKS